MKLRNCESTSTNVTRTFTVTLRERTIRRDKKGRKIRFIKMYLKQVLNVLKTTFLYIYIKQKKKISK